MGLTRAKPSTDIRFIDPGLATLTRDAFNRLDLAIEGGETFNDVRALRAFPLSSPASCIVFKTAQGTEIGVMDDMRKLPRASRKLLEGELELAYFTTRVTAISSVSSKHGFTTWDFETDRGRCTVYVRDRTDIRWLAGGRLIFTDVNGMKFEIPSVDAIDERSQALLEAET
ncbi:DUF1854 domain-containing protein [bacterium]|nr:DUF1854 domain-containing protein [bacterium]